MVLSFRLGPLPIRIHAWFVVVAGLLGLAMEGTPKGVALWGGGLLVALFVHELAHALTARRFGVPAGVEMTPLASALDDRVRRLPCAKRIVVALSGPLASLGTAAALTFILQRRPLSSSPAADALDHFTAINWGWGLLSLVPMLPFDGGRAVLAVADGLTGGRGERTVRIASVVVALALAVVALCLRAGVPALLSALLALQNARGLRSRAGERRERAARWAVAAAHAAATREHHRDAVAHAVSALAISSDPRTRTDALRLLAYGYAASDAWRPLLDLLESGGARAMQDDELEKYERAARELGRHDDAARIAVLRRGGGVERAALEVGPNGT